MEASKASKASKSRKTAAYKYEYRAGLKGSAEEDLKKAQWYNDYAESLINPIIENDVHLKTVPVECYNALKAKLKEMENDDE